jgi:phospholipid/cholesterol/gamma-HCH transport system permease protein
MSTSPTESTTPRWQRGIVALGATVRHGVHALADATVYVGGLTRLLGAVGDRVWRWLTRRGGRIRGASLVEQAIRVGVKAIPIVVLMQVFIGVILALNLAPTLQTYGQLERVADVVAIAVLRELGPLITAIILSGFAGAAIAAELGTMVEGEEIKALKAHALDPVRFLVVPRVLATMAMMVGLTVLADVAGVSGGLLTAVGVLGVPAGAYLDATRAAVDATDYFTGLFKAGVFGVIVASLACYEGLNVRGGAEGVGRATTTTVVKCIVALIGADMVFTAIFYVLEW